MGTKKDLEATLKEKVVPLLEETMEKHWGITIPKLEDDITDQLRQPFVQVYVSSSSTFKEAKKKFKAQFLEKELKLHRGNVSQLAKHLGIDRRSVHRAIKNLDIDIEAVRDTEVTEQFEQEKAVDHTLRASLNQYRDIIQPEKLEPMYKEIPQLSRNIAQFLPHQELTMKEAEQEFEKQFLGQVLLEHKGDIQEAAQQLQIRVETLYRKVKKLKIASGKNI
ncbi:hypothetical protein HOI26_03135 [Candidatus Woesearchaeota archaeon]|jgi:transcriptional regulator with PAS, ATPase and Fis domain|nr:hypothetical protein [Candidatus Woesearchaeota archaeon]MBT5740073.1 hypothetical protein [Candidatus Woesearchaeota archaeon]